MSSRNFVVSDFSESFGVSRTMTSLRIVEYIEARDSISFEIVQEWARDIVIEMFIEKNSN